MTPNRKRGRSFLEDEVEFVPLSKRINNLHINNGLLVENPSLPMQPSEWGGTGGPPTYSQNLPQSPPQNELNGPPQWSNAPQYTPDLSESQNPHYFNVNKLLFEMYVQRLQRAGFHHHD